MTTLMIKIKYTTNRHVTTGVAASPVLLHNAADAVLLHALHAVHGAEQLLLLLLVGKLETVFTATFNCLKSILRNWLHEIGRGADAAMPQAYQQSLSDPRLAAQLVLDQIRQCNFLVILQQVL